MSRATMAMRASRRPFTITARRRDIASSAADSVRGAPRTAADWLSLAATPTFAVMALVTVLGGGTPDMPCMPAHDASPINGMALMYLLMSAFHLSPWLKLFASRRDANARA